MSISLNQILPRPQHANPFQSTIDFNRTSHQRQLVSRTPTIKIPPYGKRSHYLPREPADFGDGGAFPEILIKQYPLSMGRKDLKNALSDGRGVVALRVDASGEVQYDAVLREGMRKDQIMYSRARDLQPKDVRDTDLIRPSKEDEDRELEKTKAALANRISNELEVSRPRSNATNRVNAGMTGPTYIRYTPGNNAEGHNSGARSRMIKVFDMPVDPLEPPKFKHKKLPARPPSPPVPVMHSPPRKITVEDQKNWKIPPCVSNWKNNKGFTMPLHQRLAADGRGLQDRTINDKFAKLSETLLMTEKQARLDVERRAKTRQLVKQKEKQQKEQELIAMARMAKDANLNRGITGRNRADAEEDDGDRRPPPRRHGRDVDPGRVRREEEERENMRRARRRERIREFRMEQNRSKKQSGRQRERDVTEVIALEEFTGEANRRRGMNETFDSRLYNQDGGLDAGFGAEDDNNVYTTGLMNSFSTNLYRPQGDDGDFGGSSSRTKANLIFEKEEGEERTRRSASADSSGSEKERTSERDRGDDPFDLSRHMTQSRRPSEKLKGVGRHEKGFMHASGGADLSAARSKRGDRGDVSSRFVEGSPIRDSRNAGVKMGLDERKEKHRGRDVRSRSRERQRRRDERDNDSGRRRRERDRSPRNEREDRRDRGRDHRPRNDRRDDFRRHDDRRRRQSRSPSRSRSRSKDRRDRRRR